MIGLSIILEGDNCWPDLAQRGFIEGKLEAVALLENGTTDGNPTVTFRVALPDGQTVLAETTVRLFLAAASAVRARTGDP